VALMMPATKLAVLQELSASLGGACVARDEMNARASGTRRGDNLAVEDKCQR
jgi:hypothetical protein